MSHLLSLCFLVFLPLLLPVCAQRPPQPPKTVLVSVMDSQLRPVTGLPQSAFTVFEGKQSQTVASFTGDEKSVSVGILFDVSRSAVSGINPARHGLLEFFKVSNPSNEYFIMGFSEQTRLVTDWTRSEDEFLGGLNQLPALRTGCPVSCSKLYDAFFPAVEKLGQSSHPKRALLVITDGMDHESKRSQKELLRLARERDVLIYVVILSNSDQGSFGLAKEAFMERLAELTGGYTISLWNPRGEQQTKFMERNVEFKETFRIIAATLRSQYEVRYQPTNDGSGEKTNKIKLELKLSPDLKKQIGKFKVYHRSEFSNEN